MAANTLHAVAFGYDIENEGRSQILFNQLAEKINRVEVWQAIDVPLNRRGQQQTEKDLLAAFVAAFPNRRFAIGKDEHLRYSEVFIYDVALWDSVKEYRPGVPESYGKFQQLVPTQVAKAA